MSYFSYTAHQAKTNKMDPFGDPRPTMLALYDGDLDLYLEANKPIVTYTRPIRLFLYGS